MFIVKTVLRYVLGAFFVFAGINHFRKPAFYVSIMPSALPAPLMLVYVSGVAEVVLGAAVLLPGLQSPAAWGLVALLIAVFPANIHMAMHPQQFPAFPPVLLWLRLPLQAVLIAWAYAYTRR